MTKSKKYWKSTEELENNQAFLQESEKEFTEQIPVDEFLGNNSLSSSSTNRRDFLKFLGFSVGAATLAACESPVKKAIPYLNKPEEVTPGVANWYASTYWEGRDYCPVLVKTREGRPIFIEGNNLSTITRGVNARVQASVLSLYDSGRMQGPAKEGELTTWDVVDGEISAKLSEIRSNGGKVGVVTPSLISPSTKKAIDDFCASFSGETETGETFPNASHVVYDAISYSAIRKANGKSFGEEVVPSYSFDKANVIVSVGADFISSWLSPIEFSAQYASGRKAGKDMSKHIQFEANMSLTGSNADERFGVKPSQYGAVLSGIYNQIAKLVGAPSLKRAEISGELAEKLNAAANHLLKNKGKSIVVVGTNNVEHQELANGINSLLGNYGNTIDLGSPMLSVQSDDDAVKDLVKEMNSGSVDALVLYGVNPCYTMPDADGFVAAMTKVGLTISFADRIDETAKLCGYVCPDNHYLESWGDANPRPGFYSLQQPTIKPLFNTRQAQESLLKWAGVSVNYRDYVKENLTTNHFSSGISWDKCLHDGVAENQWEFSSLEKREIPLGTEINSESLSAAGALVAVAKEPAGYELTLYEKTGIGNGSHANNPWLQELPDPVSKVCWDNYLTMNPIEMKEKGFNTMLGQVQEADVVSVTVNGKSVNVPVYPQYGQARGTLGLALGYGRVGSGAAGDGVGVNAYALNSGLDTQLSNVEMSGTVGKYHIASTQTHHTMMGRDTVRETTLDEYLDDPKSNNPDVLITSIDHKKKKAHELNLWRSHPREGHFWNLSVDLNACIGCGSCVVACTSENNVPVVGKEEIRRSRNMHWLRIDRYYSSDMTEQKAENQELGSVGKYKAMEVPSETPEVVFQPIMCQHCNHAPCETVCPVAATTHSSEGLNQMVYNRCVGTKFCLNNCPYKVRRFNWFNYNDNTDFASVNPAQDDLGRMVLNPDVTVRARGVMEKCSMCVQRIQEGKLKAKKEGRKIKDGEFTVACATACPTDGIVFGDVNDPKSKVAELREDPRRYYLLEELNTQPSVHYLTKVRNKNKA